MKGKRVFTRKEIDQIKNLIVEKLFATSDKQKEIRNKIRRIGFYFSDFNSKKDGYTVADFNQLIDIRKIQVFEDNIGLSSSAIAISTFKPVKQQDKIKNTTNISLRFSKNSLAPIVDNNTQVLILGTMPGDRSLFIGEYYAHPGNRFWKIISKITKDNIPTSYNEKKHFLIRHRIGLWDIANKANRGGSLDSDMSVEIPNDPDDLLVKYSNIKVIGFNGSKAAELFHKFFKKQPQINYYNLPSTSGANTSILFADNCAEWKQIVNKKF